MRDDGAGSTIVARRDRQRQDHRNGETAEMKRTRSSSKNGGGGAAKAVAEFRTEGGYGVTEEDGFTFE